MQVSVQTIIEKIAGWAPPSLAEKWDNVGLLLGNPQQTVKKVLTALDVTPENVAYAIEHEVDLIVAHHPLIFKPLANLQEGKTVTDLIAALQRHHIAVYAAHTNLDIAEGGVNDMLAEQLGLTAVKGLHRVQEQALYKIAVYVPKQDGDRVRQSLGDAGAGALGNYSHCSFTSAGTGRFLPGEGAQPHIGTLGELTRVEEEKVEVIVSRETLANALQAMLAVHPYEEPAYDIYPLSNQGKGYYLGRIGEWPEAVDTEVALQKISHALGMDTIRYSGHAEKIKRIALCGGAGMEFWPTALAAGADLYITGDVKYHEAQDAQNAGLMVVDGHHFYTEQNIAKVLQERITAWAKENNWDCAVEEDLLRKDVFSFYRGQA